MTRVDESPAMHGRKRLHEVTRDLAAVAMGFQAADLIIMNGRLVNVNTAQIQDGVDVAVRHGFIALVGDAKHVVRNEKTVVVDAAGRYLVPGFIDSHMHIESTMVDPRSFAAGVLPHGTTTICPDNQRDHQRLRPQGRRALPRGGRGAAPEGLPRHARLRPLHPRLRGRRGRHLGGRGRRGLRRGLGRAPGRADEFSPA